MIGDPRPKFDLVGAIFDWFAVRLIADKVHDGAQEVSGSIDDAKKHISIGLTAIVAAILVLCIVVIVSSGSRRAKREGDSLFTLGQIYMTGEVERSTVMAVQMYKVAAQYGNPDAGLALAQCYADGTYVQKDAIKAFRWYKMAAKGGNVDAQQMLAICYENGVGTKVNEKLSLRWYKKAARRGDSYSKLKVEQAKKAKKTAKQSGLEGGSLDTPPQQ